MKKLFLVISLLIIAHHAFLQTSAQWQGPDRSGVYPESNLLTSWPAEGPALLWSVEGIGKGYSSAVSDGTRTYVTGMKESNDCLTAIDSRGNILWQVPFGKSWEKSFPETRTTPTVENGRVYVISGNGIMACIDAKDGRIIWSFDAIKRFDGAYGDWGVCESLLLVDDKVIYTPAGPKTTMVALDKNTGGTLWMSESLNDTSAYVSPRLIAYGGKKIIVTIINKYFLGVEAGSGKILWSFDYAALKPEKSMQIWPGAPKTNTNTPLFDQGNIYITGGYNHVGAMFRMAEDVSKVELLWTDTILDCHHGGVVMVDGYIYGSNWVDNSRGNWCCIDWKTGKKMYEEKWLTKGAIIAADGMLYCYEEKTGNLGLVKANPQQFGLVSSFRIPLGNGPSWAHPVIHDGILYVRHGNALMAYAIRKK